MDRRTLPRELKSSHANDARTATANAERERLQRMQQREQQLLELKVNNLARVAEMRAAQEAAAEDKRQRMEETRQRREQQRLAAIAAAAEARRVAQAPEREHQRQLAIKRSLQSEARTPFDSHQPLSDAVNTLITRFRSAAPTFSDAQCAFLAHVMELMVAGRLDDARCQTLQQAEFLAPPSDLPPPR